MSSNEDDTSRNQPGAGWSNGDLHPQLYASTRTGKLQLYDKHRRWIGLSQGWTRISKGTSEQDAKHSSSHTTGTRLVTTEEEESKSVKCLIAQLCERFYHLGWATGTGGGVSIRVGGPSQNRPWKVFVAPSGIQKEDMIGDDVFTLDMNRNIIEAPKTPNLKQSACTPLWYVVYKHRPTATCVIHTHSMYAQLVTLLDYPKETKNVLRLTHLEMLKGVGNHAYDDVLEIPIIDNRPSEDLLASQLEKAIQQYPYCNAVLVRRHGVYVWGDSWEQAKTQCESFDYLFHTAIQMKQMGVDCSALPQGGTYRPTQDETKTTTTSVEPLTKKIKLTEENGFNGVAAVSNQDDVQSNVVPLLPRDKAILLLDIEGCTTSIAFVKEVLFPYVLETIEFFIDDHYPLAKRATSSEYQQLCQALQKDVQEHADKKGDASLPDPKDAVAMVQWLVQRDVKAAGLKSLQGVRGTYCLFGVDDGVFVFCVFINRLILCHLVFFFFRRYRFRVQNTAHVESWIFHWRTQRTCLCGLCTHVTMDARQEGSRVYLFVWKCPSTKVTLWSFHCR